MSKPISNSLFAYLFVPSKSSSANAAKPAHEQTIYQRAIRDEPHIQCLVTYDGVGDSKRYRDLKHWDKGQPPSPVARRSGIDGSVASMSLVATLDPSPMINPPIIHAMRLRSGPRSQANVATSARRPET